MPVTLVPDEGSIIKNFQIVNSGSIFDGNEKIITQGTFLKGKLNGDNCILTRYGGEDISIRKGTFSNGLENGNIFEYVFLQAEWEKLFVNNSHISVTRYTHVFANGVWHSTSATATVTITGTRVFNDKHYLVGFTFSEI